MVMWQMWLIISGICFIIEIITVGFFAFWFAIGALFAMIVSFFFSTNLIAQTTVFLISSTILLFATRPFLKKFAQNNSQIQTNAYSIIGKHAIVTSEISPEKNQLGQIKIDGETWTARFF